MKLENDLGRDDIKQLVRRIALPSMLAQFVSVLYSIVDRMYIGNIKGVGTLALAGVGVCGPVLTMIGSFAFLVGIGGAPLMSMRLGEDDREEAKNILANSFLMLLIFSIVLTALVYPLREPMLRAFGASDTTWEYANIYFTIYLSGTVFALISTGMNQFIISQGYSKIGMKSVLIGAVLNILLDPVFIFLFHMGVAGAAVATVLSQLGSCMYVLCFLFSNKVPIKITFGNYSLKTMRRILLIGLSPFLIIAFDNIMIIALNTVLQNYGGAAEGDLMITCATITQSFMLVVTMPLGGITGGTQTILAFNYGARRGDRVKQAQKYIFLLCTIFTGVMTIIGQFGGSLFVRLFTQDAVLAKEAIRAIKISTLALIPLGFQYEIVDGFTALGKVSVALPLSMLRKTVFFISLFVFPPLLGVRATFYAEPMSDIISPIVSAVVYCCVMNRILKKRESI